MVQMYAVIYSRKAISSYTNAIYQLIAWCYSYIDSDWYMYIVCKWHVENLILTQNGMCFKTGLLYHDPVYALFELYD